MPNDVTDAIHAAVRKAETFLGDEAQQIEQALDREWQAIKPDVIALGKTILSQVMQAAITYVLSGGPSNPTAAVAAIASITAQLPADKVAAQHLVAAAFAGAVQNVQAKQAAGAVVQ